MTTKQGIEVVVRYRWGSLTIKNRETKEELFRKSVGNEFDGHLTLYEVQDELQDTSIEFSVSLPQEFYGFSVYDCELEVFGDWITGLSCDDCEWHISSEEVPKFEYETVLPPYCPECKGEFTVETDTPDQLQKLQDSEKIPEELLNTLDGIIQN